MRSIRVLLGIGVGALALGACGSAQGASGELQPLVPTPLATASATPPSATGSRSGAAEDRGPAFPLTLRRTGGIAGFDDTVVLKPSGEVLVETRSVHGRVCVLPKPQRERLFTVLATLRQDDGSVTSGGTVGSDVSGGTGGTGVAPNDSDLIHISLTDAHRHPFDLADPSLGSVSDMVGAFVADVTLSSPATISCTTRLA